MAVLEEASMSHRGPIYKLSMDYDYRFSTLDPALVDGLLPIKLTKGLLLCIRSGSNLHGFEYSYSNSTVKWEKRWKSNSVYESGSETLPLSKTSRTPTEVYPWAVSKMFDGENGTVVVTRAPVGLQFYQVGSATPGLHLLGHDRRFHDVYGWNDEHHTLLFGRFYPEAKLYGIMSRDHQGQVKFYSVNQTILKEKGSLPVQDFRKSQPITSSAFWTSSNTTIFLSDIYVRPRRRPQLGSVGKISGIQAYHQEAFILRGTSGLQIYAFDANFNLQLLFNTTKFPAFSPGSRSVALDHLWFPNSDPGAGITMRNALTLNDTGLYTYKYDPKLSDYTLLDFQPNFSTATGWNPGMAKTIHFIDLNDDGNDDLIFTGPTGLSALTFDSVTSRWMTILEPANVPAGARFARLIGVANAHPDAGISTPLLFSQDFRDQLLWGQLTEVSQVSSTTTVSPRTTLTPTTTTPQRAWSEIGVTVQNTPRLPWSTKRHLRLEETWKAYEFLKDPVDIASGRVQFTVPLVDISYQGGLGLQLLFTYDSANIGNHALEKSSEIGGGGWSSTLCGAQDFISVDYHGSIWEVDFTYALHVQGSPPQPLTRVPKPSNQQSKHIHLFQLKRTDNNANENEDDQAAIQFTYDAWTQRWTAESSTERAMFGAYEEESGMDEFGVVQWGLSWPNWRGKGTDQDAFTPIPLKWFLTTRSSTNEQGQYSAGHRLTFFYQQEFSSLSNGKRWTRDVRLVSVKYDTTTAKSNMVDNEVTLDLHYSLKSDKEYTARQLVDGYTHYPTTTLSSSHFLQGYSLSTLTYQQRVKFLYHTATLTEARGQNREKSRILIGIQQEFETPQNPVDVLRFNYKNSFEVPIALSEILLGPGGKAGVEFKYDLKKPFYNDNPLVRIPFRDPSARLFFRPNYSLIMFQDSLPHGGVVIQILDQEKTRVIQQILVEEGLGQVLSYDLLPFETHFFLAIETEVKKILRVYYYKDNPKGQARGQSQGHEQSRSWSWTIWKEYHKSSIIKKGLSVTAVLNIVTHALDILEWNSKTNTLTSHRPPGSGSSGIRHIAVSGDIVLGYDDRDVWLFYQNSSNTKEWLAKSLSVSGVSTSGFASSSKRAIDRLDTAEENKKQVRELFDREVLQTYQNTILLSKVEIRGIRGDVVITDLLILLDKELRVVSAQEFSSHRETILDLTLDYEQEGSTYSLVYENALGPSSGGTFKVKLKSFSGEIVKQIKASVGGNRNKQTDAINEQLEKMNGSKGWKEFFAKVWFTSFGGGTRSQLVGGGDVVVGSDTLIEMTGNGWTQKSLPNIQSISLGSYFVLEQRLSVGVDESENSASFQIFCQNMTDGGKSGSSIMGSTLLKGQQAVLNRYPLYIAYQKREDSIHVLPFLNGGREVGREVEFQARDTSGHEKLMPQSDFQHFITVVNSTDRSHHAETFELIFRPVAATIFGQGQGQVSNDPLRPWVVSELRLFEDPADDGRITGFDRQKKSDPGNNVDTEVVRVIPGGVEPNGTLTGWKEYSWSASHFNRTNVTSTVKVFNNQGHQIASPASSTYSDVGSSSDRSSKATKKYPGMLWDKSEKWLISDFTPWNLAADQPVGYLGFEDYENWGNGSGRETTWKFPDNSIVKDYWAFTGRNVLRLSNGELLEGSFRIPSEYQGTIFVVSCWIRMKTKTKGSGNLLLLKEPTNHLKGVVTIESDAEFDLPLLGVTRRLDVTRGEWAYLELILNFSVIHDAFQAFQRYKGNYDVVADATKPTFNIEIKVSNDNGRNAEHIDVDHIRVTPIEHDFKATVYDPKTGVTTAIINSNGLVTRTFFDDHFNEIATIDGEGFIDRLTRERRFNLESSSSPPFTRITLSPESAIYQDFYPAGSHGSSLWSVSNPAEWSVSPGQLYHKGLGKNALKIFPSSSAPQLTSAALRFYYAMESPEFSLQILIHMSDDQRSNSREVKLVLEHYRSPTNTGKITLIVASDPSPSIPIMTSLSGSGEVIVMIEGSRLFLWLDNLLIMDRLFTSTSSSFSMSTVEFHLTGPGLIQDLFVLLEPSLEIEYINIWGETVQKIQLENENSALVNQIFYDILGRPTITTRVTRVTTSPEQSLVGYYLNFVQDLAGSRSNGSAGGQGQSRFQLKGLVSDLNPQDEGCPYSEKIYDGSPSKEAQVAVEGSPGPKYSSNGPYAKRWSTESDIAIVFNLFPPHLGYRQRVKWALNGSQHVSIFDQKNRRVGLYIRVAGSNHVLSTYEYDDDDNLIKILPPLYHKQVSTAAKLSPYKFGTSHLTPKEQSLQQSLCTFMKYDAEGRLTRKQTPDSGVVHYVYINGQLSSMSTQVSEQTEKVVYFNYDNMGQLLQTGFFFQDQDQGQTRNVNKTNDLLGSDSITQSFAYSDNHYDPRFRGQIKRFITMNGFHAVTEELRYNIGQQVTFKRTIFTVEEDDPEMIPDVEKSYDGHGRLSTIVYPTKVKGSAFKLIYGYNKQHRLVTIGVPGSPTLFGKFEYLPNGQLASETHQPFARPTKKFIRQFKYNGPGFLEEIWDPFLNEKVDYIEGGFGQAGFGDGMVMRTTFNATWTATASGLQGHLTVPKNVLGTRYSESCINALKTRGYLSKSSGRVLKEFKPAVEFDPEALPILCRGQTSRRLARILTERRIPAVYGHLYTYGNHEELIKAKYFTEDTLQNPNESPLTISSFARDLAPSIDLTTSRNIWTQLVNASFLFIDSWRRENGSFNGKGDAIFGKRAKSFINPNLQVDLLQLQPQINNNSTDISPFVQLIQGLLTKSLASSTGISSEYFHNTFEHWSGEGVSNPGSSHLLRNMWRGVAGKFYTILTSHGYLTNDTIPSPTPKILHPDFQKIVGQNPEGLRKVVKALLNHFAHELGQSAFDLESYKIDANGNHHCFNRGFHWIQLYYHRNTNKISHVVKQEYDQANDDDLNYGNKTTYRMGHDWEGNVIKAEHKGIQLIEYEPTSQRVRRITMMDGRVIDFLYDGQGERVLKRTFDKSTNIVQEVQYLRDEEGRVLVDKVTFFGGSGSLTTRTVKTIYIYGPRGLFGFIRDGKFHSVFTDHAGSIRLVIRDGQVVAAYDYLPYGELMKTYGSDPNSQIRYRYTGQEWDEETGLYNYHARLYDPTIGRFYQPDPKSQYFSPYKYAGNSPVSLVDPDGELAFLLICLSLAVVGAYLGGAAANNRWNPAKWDFEDTGTWVGIVGGGLAGGFLPVGFVASAGVIGVGGTIALGLGGAYIQASVMNGNWDLTGWKWDEPATFNGLFQGFASGSGIVGGARVVHVWADKVFKASTAGKIIFLGTSYTVGGSLAYGSAVTTNEGKFGFWEWDWSNPATLSALVNGFDSAMGWPHGFAQIGRGFSKLIKDPKKLQGVLGLGQNLFSKSGIKKLAPILKNPEHPLYKTVAGITMVYLMGLSSNSDPDVSRWNFAALSTYEGILNGAFFGKDITGMLKIRKADLAQAKKVDKKVKTTEPLPWGLRFNKELVSIVQKSYYKLVHQLFDFPVTSQLIRRLELDVDSKAFLQKGREGKINRQSEIPTSLKNRLLEEARLEAGAASKQAKVLQEDVLAEKKAQDGLYTEKDVEYLSCSGGRGGRRRKRTAAHAPCVVSKSNPEAEQQLEDHPAQFFATHTMVYDVPRELVRNWISGEVYKFRLATLAGNLDTFSIYPSQPFLSQGVGGIHAYWLQTYDYIAIKDPHRGPNLLFTPQLSGCSIYVGYNAQSGQMNVFHHYRYFKGALDNNAIITQLTNGGYTIHHLGKNQEVLDTRIYSDVLKYEEYGPVVPGVWTKGVASPLLYRDELGQWHFAYQKHDYAYDQTGKRQDIKTGFRIRPIEGVPVRVDPVPSPPTRPMPALLRNDRAVTRNPQSRLMLQDFNELTQRNLRSKRFVASTSTENMARDFDSSEIDIIEEKWAKNQPRVIVVENCVPWAMSGMNYALGLTCHTPRGHVMLFPKSNPLPQDQSHGNGDTGQSPPIETLKNCRPIEWNGRGSVHCQGDKTTFIYSPYNVNGAGEFFFSQLDGWLLLAYVMPAAFRSITSFATSVLWGKPKKLQDWDKENNYENDDEMLESKQRLAEKWTKTLDEIEDAMLQIQEKDVDHSKIDLVWAKVQLEERREDIFQFLSQPLGLEMKGAENVSLDTLEEKIQALKEDVDEVGREAVWPIFDTKVEKQEFKAKYWYYEALSGNFNATISGQGPINDLV